MTGKPNTISELKAVALVTFVIIGFISVFLNFKPKSMPEGHIGPIKFIENNLKDLSNNILKKRKKGKLA